MLCQFPLCEQAKWTMFVYTLNSFILKKSPANGHLKRTVELLNNAVDEIQNSATGVKVD